jgi:hypothetical protein
LIALPAAAKCWSNHGQPNWALRLAFWFWRFLKQLCYRNYTVLSAEWHWQPDLYWCGESNWSTFEWTLTAKGSQAWNGAGGNRQPNTQSVVSSNGMQRWSQWSQSDKPPSICNYCEREGHK